MLTYHRKIRPAKLHSKEYVDVAYVDGFIDGHLYLLSSDEERKAFPLYYVFGDKGPLQSYNQFKKVLVQATRLHNAAHKAAQKWVEQVRPGRGIALHHPPVL